MLLTVARIVRAHGLRGEVALDQTGPRCSDTIDDLFAEHGGHPVGLGRERRRLCAPHVFTLTLVR